MKLDAFLLFLLSPRWLQYLDPPPLSAVMTVSRADRQIYLLWRPGRKRCPACGRWQAGLRGNPRRVAPPRGGHISLSSRALLLVLGSMGPELHWPADSHISQRERAEAGGSRHLPSTAGSTPSHLSLEPGGAQVCRAAQECVASFYNF